MLAFIPFETLTAITGDFVDTDSQVLAGHIGTIIGIDFALLTFKTLHATALVATGVKLDADSIVFTRI